MRSAAEIANEYEQRQRARNPVLERMVKIRDAYNGDLIVPVDDTSAEPAVANLVLSGIDQNAARIASTVPIITSPPTRTGKAAEDRSRDRVNVWKAWWYDQRVVQMMRSRARHFIGYGCSPILITPDPNRNVPKWRTRNPLQVYPTMDNQDTIVPHDVITATVKPLAWLRWHYPDAAFSFGADARPDTPVTILEYVDPDQVSLVLYKRETVEWAKVAPHVFLSNQPNRVGQPLAVIPSRVTLDRPQGQFDQMLGMYKAQARLTALSLIATDKAVFPDTYLVSRPGEVGQFVEGPHDGRSGLVNVIRGGDVTELQSSPGFNTNPMIDRLERGQRMTGAVPAEFSGESTTNIRTGRRGDAVLSAIIDFPIMEAQEAFAESLEHENRIAAQVAKAYWGNTQTSIYMPLRGKSVGTTYTANRLFETDDNQVTYPLAGADMNGLVVGMGQRIGLGTMSRRTAAEMDPLIDDPEREDDRIVAEQLDTAVLASVQQAAQSGGLPPQVIARVAQLVRDDKADLAQAVDRATKEYQQNQQQAQQQAQQQTGIQPGMGELAQAGPTVQEGPQGMQNLAGMLTSLRKTSRYDDFQQGTGQQVRT